MHSILVDWLVEVTEEYKLVSDKALNRQRLQLLGVSAMLVAS
jgi:cyclin A